MSYVIQSLNDCWNTVFQIQLPFFFAPLTVGQYCIGLLLLGVLFKVIVHIVADEHTRPNK